MKNKNLNPELLVSGIKAFLEKNRNSFTADEIKLLEDVCSCIESFDSTNPGCKRKLGEIVFGQALRLFLNPDVLQKIGDYLDNL